MRLLPSIVVSFCLVAAQTDSARAQDWLDPNLGLGAPLPGPLLPPPSPNQLEFERLRNQAESLRNDRLALGNRWLQLELISFRKQARDLFADEHAARALLTRLQAERTEWLRFTNGAAARAATVRQVLASLPRTEPVESLLQTPVTRLPADNFRPSSQLLSLIGSDASLTISPLILAESSPSRAAWQRLVPHVGSATSTAAPLLRTFRTAAEQEYACGPATSPATAVDQANARAQLLSLVSLARNLERPAWQQKVAQHVTGYTFDGGTVDQLLRHVLDHDLHVLPGTAAHHTLAPLATAVVQLWDARLQSVAARLSELHDRHPHRGGALRERLTAPE